MLEANGSIFNESAPVRFSRVLSNAEQNPSGFPSDIVLHRDEDMIVCPTLGSFLPYWYLIIPTQHHLNFSDWESEADERSIAAEVQGLVRDVLGEDDDYIWFEHGPASRGSITGCGVDHAHVHVILGCDFGTSDMLRAAAELGVQSWYRSDFEHVFDSRTDCSEYLAFGNSSTGYLKNISKPVGSQFFRRVLSRLSGDRADWDYKQHPHHEVAQQSVDRIIKKKMHGLDSKVAGI